jgi:hypothetical protein
VGSERDAVASCCEHGNEQLCFLRGGTSSDELRATKKKIQSLVLAGHETKAVLAKTIIIFPIPDLTR